jgi:ABC-type cobalamin/Fe3+-siderophores transport system ATPase subunit
MTVPAYRPHELRGNDVNRIVRLSIEGFKSIRNKTDLDIGLLTILAGANSSGKTSFMQPLLLLKQTIESAFSARALNLEGPNVKFTSWNQVFSIGGEDKMCIGVHTDRLAYVRTFERDANNRVVADKIPVVRSNGDGEDVSFITEVIHVPGWRGRPRRTYPDATGGPCFYGPFTNTYAANLIELWQEARDNEDRSLGLCTKLDQLCQYTSQLGLASSVAARRESDAQIAILVDRHPVDCEKKMSNTEDMINLVDVGLGVSQTLPILTALLTAEQGQLIYIEQPEIHLHPRAQLALSKIVVETAKRGIPVVTETHSSLFLTGIQTQIAENKIPSSDVILHWFNRNCGDGYTNPDTIRFDPSGAFDAPSVDFSGIELDAARQYIHAVSQKEFES